MSQSQNILHLEIVAGPNGSGKTTFAQSYLVRTLKRTNYLNPDIIASGVSPSYSSDAAFQAGRIFLSELKGRIRKRESLGFETTLSGLSYLRLLKAAKRDGYKVTIYFLFTENTKINIARIKKRVHMGGHSIATRDVIRRYKRSFNNFWESYRELADNWIIFDNSQVAPKFIISKQIFDQLSQKEGAAFSKKFLRGKI